MSLYTWAKAEFGKQWQAAYGAAYVFMPKDESQLGRMLAKLKGDGIDPREIPGMFGRYVRDPDVFLVKIGHALAHFCTNGGLNKYRGQQRLGPVLTEKEQRSVGALESFLERKRGT